MPLEMKYFILKPKAKTNNDIFARASQKAMLTYADVIKQSDPLLATELQIWSNAEQEKQSQLPFDEEEK